MNAPRYQQLRTIFHEVCTCDHARRTEVMDRACAGDPGLRHDLESLLSHADTPIVDLDAAAAEVGSLLAEAERGRTFDPDAPPDIERLGRYRIRRVLGSGGMGVVYLAEQDRPSRTVALKVIRPGMATATMLRRFERETEVLARLQHPGIAQIFDAGIADPVPATGGPRPFIAMEYVDGRPLLDHAATEDLDARQRLTLFASICDAVGHAHQRGVIHRDLKPANLFVDARGEPKVLDFGVARALDPQALSITVTEVGLGQFVGTLPYMSPEVIDGSGEQADVRADVYALGVVLFELLAGRHPHDFAGRSLADIARIICDRPSPLLGSVAPAFRGDVETIVAHALERDPERRYQSVAALCDDVRRSLRDEPIEARRDSVTYVLRKRLQRSRGVVAAALVFLVGCIAFATYATIQAQRYAHLAKAEQAARVTVGIERDEARRAKDDEAAQRALAERAAARAQATSDFLTSLIRLADPDVTQTYDQTVQALLAGAAASIEVHLADQPEAEASIRTNLGRIYASLGDPVRAESHLRRARQLIEASPNSTPDDLYAALWPLVHVLADLDDIQDGDVRSAATTLGRALIRDREPEINAAFNTVLDAVRRHVPAAEIREAIRRMREVAAATAPDDSTWVLLADQFVLMARYLLEREQPATASVLLEPALEILREHLDETNTRIARTLGLLVDALVAEGRDVEAEAYARAALDTFRHLLPPDHWYLALCEARLASCCIGQGRVDETATLLASSYPRIVEERGRFSRVATSVLATRLRLEERTGDPAAARTRLELAFGLVGMIRRSSWSVARVVFDETQAPLADAIDALERALADPDDDASDEIDVVIETRRALLADADPRATVLADLFTGWGEHLVNRRDRIDGRAKRAAARTLFADAVHLGEVAGTRHARKAAVSDWWLARVDESEGRSDDAEPYARRCLRTLIDNDLGDSYGMLPNAQSLLGTCLLGQGRDDEAQPLLLDGYHGLVRSMGLRNGNTTNALLPIIALHARRPIPDVLTPILMERLEDVADAPALTRRGEITTITLAPGLAREVYQRALAMADALIAEADEADSAVLGVAGMAAARAGEWDRCLDLMARCETAGDIRATHLVYLAFARDAVGDRAGAQDAMARARDKVRRGYTRRDALWTEAIARFGGEMPVRE